MKSCYHLFWQLLMYSCARLSLLFLGFLLVSMYRQDDSSLLGHVDLSEPTPIWNTLSICPTGLTNDQNTGEKLLSVVGKGTGLSFTVQIAEGASEIALDQPHTVNVQGDQVSVFQFIPPQGISDKQLDITATSQSTVAAYLKVSQNCKEVDVQKDLESINYKKESLRLSFATKGRITLSSVSIPPLTVSVSRWFIGISLKNLSGDVKLSESKNVTLKLTRSFDYNYATPICVLVFVSFLVGILVSIFAYFLFEESLIQVKPGEGDQFKKNDNLKVLVCEMWEVIRCHWFSSGPETYSYIIGILGIVLMIGAFQFVLSYWDTMIQEGNRDNCYYNDFCYRVANHDIPFNLMISNLTYIIHGLILAVWVLMLEAKVNLRRRSGRVAVREKAIEERYPFSVGYTFSWALVFQGLLSALCHLCPSTFTYLFELAFMFVIASLTVLLLLYNGTEQNRSQNENPDDVFFELFRACLLIFYILFALLIPNSRLNKIMLGFFNAILIIWWLVVVFQEFRKLDMLPRFSGILCGSLPLCVTCMGYLPSTNPNGWALITLSFFCFVELQTKRGLWEKLLKRKFGKLLGKGTLQVIFISVTSIILVAAVLVFLLLPTTNKTSSPENYRGKNKECVILGFFDWHGLWQFVSSFALLMGAFVVMFISFEPEQCPQAERRKNKVKEYSEQEYCVPKERRAAQAKMRGNKESETPLKKRQYRVEGEVIRKYIRKERTVQAKTRGNKESETPLKKRQYRVEGEVIRKYIRKERTVQAKTRGNKESEIRKKEGKEHSEPEYDEKNERRKNKVKEYREQEYCVPKARRAAQAKMRGNKESGDFWGV